MRASRQRLCENLCETTTTNHIITMMPPPTTTAAASMEESPTRPVPPPTKKQRSGTPGVGHFLAVNNRDRMSDATEDAIARRRAELRRLQKLRAPAGGDGGGTTSTAAVLAMARNQLGGGGRGAPPPVGSTNTTTGPPPVATNHNNNNSRPNVPRQGLARVRNSDIFPNAPKLVDSPMVQPHTARKCVARTLEFPSPTSPDSPRFQAPTASSRAKSAPPMRPPPPPGRPQAAAEAPPTVADRARSDRPPPTPFQPKRGGIDKKTGPEKGDDGTKAKRPPPTPYYPKKETKTNGGSVTEAKSASQKATNGSAKNPVPGKPVVSNGPSLSNGFLDPSQLMDKSRSSTVPNLVDEREMQLDENSKKETIDSSAAVEESPFSGSKSPTTPRQDLLQNLNQFADTPPLQDEEKKEASSISPHNEVSNERRLVQELRHATESKKEALRRVAELEMINKRFEEEKRNSSPAPLEKLLHIAETKGDAAALRWAREQLGMPAPVQTFSQVGFLSPVHNATRSPGPGLSALSPLSAAHDHHVRRRVATPHPKRRPLINNNTETNAVQEFLVEATKAVPFEYTSELATYVVRCPYDSDSNNIGLWDTSGVAPANVYSSTANANEPSSLEILAQVQSDGSIVTLSGVATVRHKRCNGDPGWKVYENVDEMDKMLGSVHYIDGDANEKEYWLDAIYEEALAAREAYCSSLVSTASALQASSVNGVTPPVFQSKADQKQSLQMSQNVVEPPQSQLPDAHVSKERTPETNGPPAQSAVKPAKPQTPKQESKTPSPQLEDDDATSDVMSALIATLFSTIFWFVWLVFVRIPLKLLKLSVFSAVLVAIVSALWLLIADDHGASELGAKVDWAFNPRTF